MVFAGASLGDGTVVEYCIDVGDRKRAEAAVRERDERLQLLLGHATDYAVIISDPRGPGAGVVGGAEAITGWRAGRGDGATRGAHLRTPEDRADGVPGWETRKSGRDRAGRERALAPARRTALGFSPRGSR